MESKHQVHNVIILDESGSMNSIKRSIISGFNEIVQTIKGIQEKYPEQEHYISMMSFNGVGQKLLHFLDPVTKLNEIDAHSYHPEAGTPLYDAIGTMITKVSKITENLKEFNVLVTIMTDGEENASREYSGETIKKMIEERKENNWTFTYIGTDHDVRRASANISINNVISFGKNAVAAGIMFSGEARARQNFARKVHNKENTKDGYFDND